MGITLNSLMDHTLIVYINILYFVFNRAHPVWLVASLIQQEWWPLWAWLAVHLDGVGEHVEGGEDLAQSDEEQAEAAGLHWGGDGASLGASPDKENPSNVNKSLLISLKCLYKLDISWLSTSEW